jgi:hypothetical protein
MSALLLIGIAGLAVLVLAVLFGDWFDSLLPDIELGDGIFSLPVLAGFVAAFGFAGAAAHSLSSGSVVLVAVVGITAGVGVAWLALRLSRALIGMRTDEVVRVADLVGRSGRVVTRVGPNAFGEVLVPHAGQSLKLSARADRPLERGEAVVVIEVLSPTSVRVTSDGDFWGTSGPSTEARPN